MQVEQPQTTKGEIVEFKIQFGGKVVLAKIDNQSLTAGTVKIKLHDLIGLKKKQGNGGYVLNSYPKRKKFLKGEQRYLETFEFQVKESEQKWEQLSKKIIYKINNRDESESLKLLIMFNPNSGGNSKRNLDAILQFMKQTNLQPDIFTTTHKNHAKDHLKTVNPRDYCGVAIISGDGLVHQFVNSFCDLPVTHVPAGSGNAFAKCQTLKAGELCKSQESIFLVVKNNPCKFNLMKYELQNQREPIYSFLSHEWAFIADIDMNSEFLRFLGGLRFDVYALYRALISPKVYRGRLTYSTTQTSIPPLNVDLKDNPNFQTLQQSFLHVIFTSLPYISTRHFISPLLQIGEPCIDMQIMKQDAGKIKLLNYLLSFESGGQFDLQNKRVKAGMAFEHAKIKSFRLEPLDPENPGVYGIDGQKYDSQPIQANLSDKTFKAFI